MQQQKVILKLIQVILYLCMQIFSSLKPLSQMPDLYFVFYNPYCFSEIIGIQVRI